jgi:6-phosphogluconolactonase
MQHDQLILIGTYTRGNTGSKGIYALDFDSERGVLSPARVAAETENPSFLAVHPSRQFVLAVAEVANMGGRISSYALNLASGVLKHVSTESTGGSGPCHVSIDHTGSTALVANYGSGQVASLQLRADGQLSPVISNFQHGPASQANPERQTKPHAHSIYPDPENRFAFACDLGCDRIFSYRLNPVKGALEANEPACTSTPAGGGPRHFAFHPNGKFAYANNEMGMSVTLFERDAAAGTLRATDTVSSLPEGTRESPDYTSAEITVHPNGRHLYVSNRGHNSIACFGIDAETGKLSLVECVPSVAAAPRHFSIDATGKWLLAAGHHSNDLVLFAIDPATGRLAQASRVSGVPAPVCVRFIPH